MPHKDYDSLDTEFGSYVACFFLLMVKFVCVGQTKFHWKVDIHLYSSCVSSPGWSLSASAGVTGGSGGERGFPDQHAAAAAPPGGCNLLLAAESEASTEREAAEGAADGPE